MKKILLIILLLLTEPKITNLVGKVPIEAELPSYKVKFNNIIKRLQAREGLRLNTYKLGETEYWGYGFNTRYYPFRVLDSIGCKLVLDSIYSTHLKLVKKKYLNLSEDSLLRLGYYSFIGKKLKR